MSNEVSFEEDTVPINNTNIPDASGGILAWLIKNKIATDIKQAQMYLVGFTLIASLLAVGIFFGIGGSNHKISSQQLLQMKQMNDAMKSQRP